MFNARQISAPKFCTASIPICKIKFTVLPVHVIYIMTASIYFFVLAVFSDFISGICLYCSDYFVSTIVIICFFYCRNVVFQPRRVCASVNVCCFLGGFFFIDISIRQTLFCCTRLQSCCQGCYNDAECVVAGSLQCM